MGEPVSAAVSVGYKVLMLLWQVKEVCDKRSNNNAILRELGAFVKNLERDLALLRDKTPCNNTSAWAASSLRDELINAADYLERCLQMNYFKSLWSANDIEGKLITIRDNLLTSFQTTLQIISFDVAIDGQKKQDEFRRKLFRVQNHHIEALADVTSNLDNLTEAFTSMRQEVKETVMDMRLERQEMVKLIVDALAERQRRGEGNTIDVARAIDEVRNTEAQTRETEKFFADVLANLENLKVNSRESLDASDEESEPWFEDPLTNRVMCDPVKGTDGRTYDRWTIIDNNLVKCPYDSSMLNFGVVCDDIDVRRRLFRKFPDQEQEFRARRQRHRLAAFQHADRGEYADALAKLNHVLLWNRSDQECAKKRDEVQQLIRRIPQSAPTRPPTVDQQDTRQAQTPQQVPSGPGTQIPSPPSHGDEFVICAQGAANWNPQATLAFAEDRLSVKVETKSSVSLFANHCCPESVNGYYFEVLLKSGRGVSIGFDILSSKEVLSSWVGGTVKLLDGAVGFLSYSSSHQLNVFGRGVKGEVSCCFQMENVEDDHVFGDAPIDPIRCGDTIGAGINFQRREIFFTKNNKLRWLVYNVSLKSGYACVPSFGVDSPGGEIHVNFGNFRQKPLLFAYETVYRGDWRKRVNGRRVEEIYYGYHNFEEERELGRTLGTTDRDSTAIEECCYKKILVGKVGCIGSVETRGSLRSTGMLVAPSHVHELCARARYPKANLTFTEDKLEVTVKTNEVTSPVDILANRVCPVFFRNLPGYYFEVLLGSGEEISVGMFMLRNKLWPSQFSYSENVDGWVEVCSKPQGPINVWGNGAATGQVWCCLAGNTGEIFEPEPVEKIAAGDTIGCGVNFERREFFFTKNGKLSWLICDANLDRKHGILPACRISPPGAHVSMNFGQRPFQFGFEWMFQAEWRDRVAGRRAEIIFFHESHRGEEKELCRFLGAPNWCAVKRNSTSRSRKSFMRDLEYITPRHFSVVLQPPPGDGDSSNLRAQVAAIEAQVVHQRAGERVATRRK